MLNKNSFIYKYILLLISLSTLGLSLAFAANVQSNFTANKQSLKVGEEVQVNLKIVGSSNEPVYTVVSNLKYDPKYLQFISSAIGGKVIALTPDDVTDVAAGLIKRSGGYTSGLTNTADFITYKFKAVKAGKSSVSLYDSGAYNKDSDVLNISDKSITLNIDEVVEEVKKDVSKKATKTEEVVKLPVQEITIDLTPNSALNENGNYVFNVDHNLKYNNDTTGTTTFKLIDSNGEVNYSESTPYNQNDNFRLSYEINYADLTEGVHSALAESIYDGQKSSTRIAKDVMIIKTKEIVKEPKNQTLIYWIIALAIISILALIKIIHSYSKNNSKLFNKKERS